MNLDNQLVFLDTETTGLAMYHEIWEIAYAEGDGPIRSHILSHTLENATEEALRINRYHERVSPGLDKINTEDLEEAIRFDLDGKTIVGANPAFDAYRLAQRWGETPWHYRLVDVESMAVPLLGLTKPLGLKGLVDALRERGWEIPENDHTAAGDVATVRAVYKALMTWF